MTSSDIPPNAYTEAPEQHSNLILGSIQLLFWIFFRPSAWHTYLVNIDPALNPKFQSWKRVRRENLTLWKLLIQGYLILPLLFNLSSNLVMLAFGKSVDQLIFHISVGLTVSIAFGITFALAVTTAFGLIITTVVSVAFAIAFEISLRAVAITIALITFFLGFELYKNKQPIGSVWSVLVKILGKIGRSIKFVVVPLLKLLRWIILLPFIKLSNWLLYRYDRRPKTKNKSSLLRYNSAFWDEWQDKPLKGLDKHLILVMERNPNEGNAAIKYLSTRHQRWAAQAALIEMDTRKIEKCDDLATIRQINRDLATKELELETLVSTIIRRFSGISENVDAALNQVTNYSQRMILNSVGKDLDRFSAELTIRNDEYAIRLQSVPIFRRWFAQIR